MQIKELIKKLKTLDPNAVIVEQGPRGYSSQFDSTNVTINQGFFVTNEVDEPTGLFVEKSRAMQVEDDSQQFLDLTSPTIVKDVKLHWET